MSELNHDFYAAGNKRWRKKRAAILRRDRYKCQESKRFGRNIEATHVHHIYPLEEYPQYAYENWNLISLSAESHNAMHNKMQNELTKLGKEWKKKTIPPYPKAKKTN